MDGAIFGCLYGSLAGGNSAIVCLVSYVASDANLVAPERLLSKYHRDHHIIIIINCFERTYN